MIKTREINKTSKSNETSKTNEPSKTSKTSNLGPTVAEQFRQLVGGKALNERRVFLQRATVFYLSFFPRCLAKLVQDVIVWVSRGNLESSDRLGIVRLALARLVKVSSS